MTKTNHSLGALAAAVGALVAVGLVVLSLLAVEAQPVGGRPRTVVVARSRTAHHRPRATRRTRTNCSWTRTRKATPT
jgi:hypothetical protein